MGLEDRYGVTKSFLDSLYKYEPETGYLYARTNARLVGVNAPFGSKHIDLYVKDSLTGKYCWVHFLTHRLIYIMHYGEIPPNHWISFTDGQQRNTKIDNLVALPDRRGYHSDYE